ncbi:MAG: phage terminase small subunit P27 family [Acidobacteria bacterium]|nr:phage terminase small subunit P27 family [Acidobacteriota bacterium]
MGYRGPAPKPTALRMMEGNPGHRPLNGNEPRPRPVAPKCPAHLDKEAKREWRRMVPILLRMGVLSEADGHALANLCLAYSRLIRAQLKLNESGLLMKTPSGFLMQNPLIAIINSSVDTINRISREFGLTPASRSRLHTSEPQDDAQRIEELMFGD